MLERKFIQQWDQLQLMAKDIFNQFIKHLESITKKDIDFDTQQKRLFNELFKLERGVRDALLSHEQGIKLYEKFMFFVSKDLDNLLTVRLYFRERGSTFGYNISKAFKNKNPKVFHKYHPNYFFIKWVTENYSGPKKAFFKRSFARIEEIRREMCESNILLALNRAKLYWSKIPEGHLTYMDLIQDACEGLVVTIDKYVPPYRNVWRSVAIGRMTLNMSTDASGTILKFSPNEKRIIYRVNNAIVKEKKEKIEDILEYVKESFGDVTKEKLESLISASRHLEGIEIVNDDGRKAGDWAISDSNPEIETEKEDLSNKLFLASLSLSVLEQKIIKLKNGYGG